MSFQRIFQAKPEPAKPLQTKSLFAAPRPAPFQESAQEEAAFPPIHLGQDHSAIPFKPVHPAPALGPSSISCPFTPERCPFGGACHACPPKMQMQAKLKIGQPGDRYEQEADRVAEQVMRMPEPQAQRKAACASCADKDEEDKLMQTKPLAEQITPLAQRKPGPEAKKKDEDDDELLQAKSASAIGNAQEVHHPLIQSVLASPGQPLDAATRSFMEPRFGQDFSGVRVHVGGQAAESARAVNARAYTVGRDVVFGEGQYAPGSDEGKRLLAHELAHTVQQDSAGTLRWQSSGAAKQPKFKRYVIKIPAGITTQQQFLRYAEVQIFGRVLTIKWEGLSAVPVEPAKHIGQPIDVDVATSLLKKFGSPEGTGDAKAEKAEAEKTYKGLEKEEKKAIDVEIDQRYYKSTEETPGTEIKPGETVKAIIWNSLKQQVLADRKKVEQLPETVKSLLGESNFTPEHYQALVQLGETLSQLSDTELKAFFVAGPNGTAITPADYPQLLNVARKLANLPPEARQDYLSRVNASTASLNELEKSIDNYLQFRAEREKQVEHHETVTKPLLGAEDIYTAYHNYKALKNNVAMASALKGVAKDKAAAEDSYEYLQERLRDSETVLLAELKHKGFDSIAAFEEAIESYRVAFRTQAVNLALDVLARYEHMLFEERKRLQQGAATSIAQGIGATKASEHYKEYHTQETTASNLQMAHEPKETWWVKPYNEAKSAAATAKASAEKEVLRGSGGDPLIKERGINLEKLVGADAAGVQSYLTEEIGKRTADIQTTRQEFKDDPDRIFKLPDLVGATYKLLGVDSSTVYGRIIKDYIDDDAWKHLLSSIAIGILAIALTFLVPGGGWLAAATLVAQAGLSTYQAYQAYKEYQEQERDYELGFLMEQPSLFWVGVAIAGAALDIGVASTVLLKQSATALKALRGPMLQFAKDGDAPTLLAKIEAAEGLDAKVKAALARELKASEAAKESWKEVVSISSRVGGFAGMVDPGLATHSFRALYYSIKRGINTIVKLSADAKFLEIAGDITKMSGAERAQLEAAFEEVKNLVKIGGAKGMDESSLVNFIDRWALNRNKLGLQTKLLDEMNAWKPLTTAQKKALDALNAQRRLVTTLQEQKEAVLEELATLRAKADKNAGDIKEIRELEKELCSLDPKALPDKKPATGIGKIAEAEKKLEEVEKEAAEAQLSLYDRMRNAQPSEIARESALKARSVEDIASPLKTKPTPKQVDHIVSVREISDMEGFADLPLKNQREIVNMRENLIAMDGSANASKNDWPWKSWPKASKFYEQATIDVMVKREADVRALIEAEIKNRLDKLAAKP